MSNVEVVARCLTAISERDAATLKALSAEDIEVVPLRAMLEDTTYRGHEGIDRWLGDLADAWAELQLELERIEEPDSGTVVAYTTIHGRGHQSDVPTHMPVEMVAQLRDGLVHHAEVRLRSDTR